MNSAASVCSAQSSDAGFPTPVFSNELAGSISPRDIGDARRTRHFYTFRGAEGDLLVTVESTDLNGDVDVFTANTLRPLLKFTLFGGGATRASKSVYLRKEETLVLRVEARTVGDADGSYRIKFGGAFAPAPADLARAQEAAAPAATGNERSSMGGIRRVTSTGARIEEPVAEVAKEEAAGVAPSKNDESQPDAASVKNRTTERRESARTRASRGARGTTSRARNRGARPTPSETSSTGETTGKEAPAVNPEHPEETPSTNTTAPGPARIARAPRARGTRAARKNPKATENKESAATAGESAAPSQTPPGQRLIIITKSGDIIQRDMSAVRRVTVENNQVVILLMDGKILRQPLANVLRMSIEP
ncbi:MAG: hypothetical protein LC754_13345 [Acidobacteria bacterium]|nr:hypothetical protein [Acidobacteriota bacterium]